MTKPENLWSVIPGSFERVGWTDGYGHFSFVFPTCLGVFYMDIHEEMDGMSLL